MHRLVLSLSATILITMACTTGVHAATTYTQLGMITPALLDGTIVYPATPNVLAQDPFMSYEWQHIILPQSLVREGVVMQLWDSNNRPISQFGAQDLESTVVDISVIDPTLYPSVRIVLFDRYGTFTLDGKYPVYVTSSSTFNSRLVVFIGFFILLIVGLLSAAVKTRASLKQIVTHMLAPSAKSAGIVHSGIASLLCLSVFAIALGSYTSMEQAIYLIIKFPILFYGSFCISFGSIVIILSLLGNTYTSQKLAALFTQSLLYTSCLLASFAPLVVFYIHYPFTHDELLTMVMLLFALAAVGGVIGLARNLYQQTRNILTTALVVFVWLLVYGGVHMQLGWMLRPWVGERDPVTQSVPFARPYSGNVFTEITHTIERL